MTDRQMPANTIWVAYDLLTQEGINYHTHKISAIKLLREKSNGLLSLKGAKDLVEAVAQVYPEPVELKLYHFQRDDTQVKYDETAGAVVIATSVDHATQILEAHASGDQRRTWPLCWRAANTQITELGKAGDGQVPRIVMEDYRAG